MTTLGGRSRAGTHAGSAALPYPRGFPVPVAATTDGGCPAPDTFDIEFPHGRIDWPWLLAFIRELTPAKEATP